MTASADLLLRKYYAASPHPYRLFELLVDQHIGNGQKVLLDAGCGRSAPVLRKYVGRARRLIGVDLVDFTDVPTGIEAYKADLGHLPLEENSVDIILSRSVFEHIKDPDAVYRECARVLRPGGVVIFLTANMWDYGTLVARLVPNRYHARIVKAVEGRKEEDTFPTAYKTNTAAAVQRLSQRANLRVRGIQYLGQYPNYLMFSASLFFLGMCFDKLVCRFEALKYLRGWMLVTLEKPGV